MPTASIRRVRRGLRLRSVAVTMLATFAAALLSLGGCTPPGVAAGGGGGDGEPRPSGPALSAARSIGFWPMEAGLDVDACFALLREGADVAMFQPRLFESPPSLLQYWDAWFERARKAGMKTYVALDPFVDGGRALRTPEDWRGAPPNADDAEWRRLYVGEAVRLARTYRPDFYCIAVEANAYYAAKPSAYAAFRSAFAQARRAVREILPQCKVFATYQYEVLIGRLGTTEPQWEILDGDQTLEQDLVGISTYPLYQESPYDPRRVPDDYYAPLAARTRLPLFFGEIGWYSGSNGKPPSSPETQARFVAKLRTLLAGLQLEAYCWITLVDPTRHAGIEHVYAQAPEFTSLGLCSPGPTPKPAWSEWLSLRSDATPAGTGGGAADGKPAPAPASGPASGPGSATAPDGYALDQASGLGATSAYAKIAAPATGEGAPAAAWRWSYRFSQEPLALLLFPHHGLAAAHRGLEVALWSRQPTKVAFVAQEKGGARYDRIVELEAASWRRLELPFSGFRLQADTKDADGRLNPGDVDSLVLIDMSGFDGKRGDNEVQIGELRRLGEPQEPRSR